MERNAWRGKPLGVLENRHRGCGRDVFRQTVPSKGGGNTEGPITDSGQTCTTDSQWWWGSEAQPSPGLEMDQALELIGEVRWCRPVQILVHENSKLELDLLWGSQPMQLPKQRSDMVAHLLRRPRRLSMAMQLPCSRRHVVGLIMPVSVGPTHRPISVSVSDRPI